MKKYTFNLLKALAGLLFCCMLDAGQVNAGTINGVVKENGTGASIANLLVGAYDSEFETSLIKKARTDANGNYSITDLPVDSVSYKVRFITYGENYVEEWYNDSPDFDGAQIVTLTSATPAFDTGEVQLTVGGKITGTVTYAGVPPTNPVYVQVYDGFDQITYTQVDSSTGTYEVVGLPTGSYTQLFYAYQTDYVSEWYNDVLSQGTADPVAVTEGMDTSDVNAQLELGGEISGQVSDANGVITGALVIAYDSSDLYTLLGFTATEAGGLYTMTGLPAGTDNLKVRFFESVGGGNGSGMNEWYNDKSSYSSANTVSTGDTGVDAFLEPRDTINLAPVYMLLGLL